MVLVSFGKLKEQLGLERTERRFTFAQLTALPELNRLAGEAHALRKAEKPLDRLQQEVMSVSERLALFAHVMDGSAFLIVPASKSETDPWVVPPEFSRYYTERTVRAASRPTCKPPRPLTSAETVSISAAAQNNCGKACAR